MEGGLHYLGWNWADAAGSERLSQMGRGGLVAHSRAGTRQQQQRRRPGRTAGSRAGGNPPVRVRAADPVITEPVRAAEAAVPTSARAATDDNDKEPIAARSPYQRPRARPRRYSISTWPRQRPRRLDCRRQRPGSGRPVPTDTRRGPNPWIHRIIMLQYSYPTCSNACSCLWARDPLGHMRGRWYARHGQSSARPRVLADLAGIASNRQRTAPHPRALAHGTTSSTEKRVRAVRAVRILRETKVDLGSCASPPCYCDPGSIYSYIYIYKYICIYIHWH
jgi:hypothetical protein